MLSAYLIGRALLEKRRAEEQAAAGGVAAAPAPAAAEPGDADSLAHRKLDVSVAVNDKLGLFSLHLGRLGSHERNSRGGSSGEAAGGGEEDAAHQRIGTAAHATSDAAGAAELHEAGEGLPQPVVCAARGIGRHGEHSAC